MRTCGSVLGYISIYLCPDASSQPISPSGLFWEDGTSECWLIVSRASVEAAIHPVRPGLTEWTSVQGWPSVSCSSTHHLTLEMTCLDASLFLDCKLYELKGIHVLFFGGGVVMSLWLNQIL